MWWCAPVVPATREAEAGGSLEPGRLRLQCEPWLSHCPPAWEQCDSVSEKEKKRIVEVLCQSYHFSCIHMDREYGMNGDLAGERGPGERACELEGEG